MLGAAYCSVEGEARRGEVARQRQRQATHSRAGQPRADQVRSVIRGEGARAMPISLSISAKTI